MPPPIPDLVEVSKLDTQFSSSPKYTQHIQYVSANTSERRMLCIERWTKERDLGQGSFGVVWLEKCIHGDDSMGKVRAVKKIQKIDCSNYHRELEAIALFSHHKYEQCFVKSYGWYDNEDSIFITMEYLPNGDLHKYLGSPLLENEGQHIVSQVLEGLDFMHQFGFVHRDLKPANILVVSKRPNWWVKIADFGISKRAKEELTALRTLTGTPAFAAPEVLGFIQSESYTNAVDIWCLGVITFLLLTGETLFKDQRRLAQYVTGSFKFPLDILLERNISEQGCEFVRSLMAPNPKDRPGANESRKNPWLDNLRTPTILEPLGTTKTSESQEALSSYSVAEASATWSALDTDKQTVKADSRAFAKPPTTTSKPENLNPTLPVRNSVSLGISTKISESQEALSSHSASEASAMWSTQDQTSRDALHSSTDEQTLKADSRASSFSSIPVEAEIYSPMEISAKTPTTTSKPENLNPTLTVRNSANARILTVLQHSRMVTSVAFSPDGKLIGSASTDWTVRLWDSSTGASRATLEGHSGIIRDFAYLAALEGHSGIIRDFAFSPDSKLIASVSVDNTVRLWDSATGASLATLEGHSGIILDIAFSPDSKLIASASWDKTVRLWDSATGASRATLEGHSGIILDIAFSPDSKLIASVSVDKTVRLWDSATGASRATLEGHSQEIRRVAFSPDGKLIASASDDETVRLWDSATGASRATLEGRSGIIRDIAFSPDGKLIASASVDKTVRLWDSATGASRATLEGHSRPIRRVAFSPDGKLIASASWDKTVRLWDSATGERLATLKGHSHWVTAIAFSPDGKRIVSASNDKTVRVWGVILPLARKKDNARARFASKLAILINRMK